MTTVKIPVAKGTPHRLIVEEFVRGLVDAGFGTPDQVIREVYWAASALKDEADGRRRPLTRRQRNRLDPHL